MLYAFKQNDVCWSMTSKNLEQTSLNTTSQYIQTCSLWFYHNLKDKAHSHTNQNPTWKLNDTDWNIKLQIQDGNMVVLRNFLDYKDVILLHLHNIQKGKLLLYLLKLDAIPHHILWRWQTKCMPDSASVVLSITDINYLGCLAECSFIFV